LISRAAGESMFRFPFLRASMTGLSIPVMTFLGGVLVSVLCLRSCGSPGVMLPQTLEAEAGRAFGHARKLAAPTKSAEKPEGIRIPVISREAIEREREREVVADLPPGWIQPIESPAEGEGPRVGGLPHGEWLLFHPVHSWTDRGRFVLGSREGEWKLYDMQGTLIRVRHFVHGKIHGTMRDRALDSEWRSYRYQDGELVLESPSAKDGAVRGN
jgi:hypothetical protein